MTPPRIAVLFRTHFWDDFAQRQFDRLLAVAGGSDVFVLVDETSGPVAVPHDRVIRVTEARLLAMGLPRAGEGNMLWFNGDYPLYAVLQAEPGYDYYLQLEYDVVINRPIAELVERAVADGADYVGLTKGEPTAEWFWRDSCTQTYALADLRHQLICLSLFSARALRHLWERRIAHAGARAAGTLSTWPFCEGFIPTELALGGFVCRELSDYGETAAYDHWPPYLENDMPRLRDMPFVHPVLDQPRYIASLHKYRIGLTGYLNPASLFHRKLRRLPARDYLPVLARSFWQKARRTLRSASRSTDGVNLAAAGKGT